MRLLQVTTPAPSLDSLATNSASSETRVAPEYFRPGFVYLVDGRTMEPVEVVLRYLSHCAIKRRNASTTIKTKCEHLYDWVTWVHDKKPDLIPHSEDLVSDYRHHLETISSTKTGTALAYGTIRARLVTICDFMSWALEEKVPNSPVLRSTPKVVGLDGAPFLRNRGPGNRVIPRERTAIIEWVRPENLTAIFNQLGSDPLNNEDPRPSRDWLIALFAATTGARRHEILALNVHQIEAIEIQDANRATLNLLKTKGNTRPRRIIVPVAVIRRLRAYIEGERKQIIAKALQKGLIKREPKSLFLNGPFCRDSCLAKPFKEKRVDEAFARAQLAEGITRSVLKIDRTTGLTSDVLAPKHCFHHLRHTYAVEAFHQYKGYPEEDRWIRIQQQLGHSSYKTTANIYCRAVSLSESKARDAFSAILKRLVDG